LYDMSKGKCRWQLPWLNNATPWHKTFQIEMFPTTSQASVCSE
jgi:hypothetical protein